ncbi:MAG: DUF4445 domain-containing protein [Ardenticatenaceae bacterium]|nr:DUF4445 domain-containing protein [Ardenticatenaceae bacterium]
MHDLTIVIGEEIKQARVENGRVIGEVLAELELPVEQPCAGRGTCGKCKILHEHGLAEPDEIEHKHLTPGELAVGNRLACRARIAGDTQVVLAPVAVFSDKNFKACDRYKRQRDVPLGLAIDLGSTTAAAFLTMLDNGEVCAGGASLNQQTVYGADVISRLSAAMNDEADALRLHRLAVSSINQAIDSLKLSARILARVKKMTIVCNPAMHHLLSQLPVDRLAVMPFQPRQLEAIQGGADLLDGIVADDVQVALPPLIGGFVGSDALACLAYFEFDKAAGPMAAIDLGTNGEIMVTDGKRILTASTAAGPAFEGVAISCGSRAVDGAVTQIALDGNDLVLKTIGNQPPVGLTGSGLLSAIQVLRQVAAIEENGRIDPNSPYAQPNPNGRPGRRVPLTPEGDIYLSQFDIRELQKAKGAIRAAIDILMAQLDLKPEHLQRVILTGSFGGQVDIGAALALGMIPPVPREIVENIPNGAGLGAATFLTEEGFARGVRLAQQAEQIDLDANMEFINRFVDGMALG